MEVDLNPLQLIILHLMVEKRILNLINLSLEIEKSGGRLFPLSQVEEEAKALATLGFISTTPGKQFIVNPTGVQFLKEREKAGVS